MPRLAELPPGTALGGFTIVRRLSEGGMGAVYLATQETTGRQRALKVMHPELVSDPGLRDKFVQEAKIGSRVESDHVVDVVDAGVDGPTGMPWLAMELLLGEDLGAMLARRGHVPIAEVAAIFEPLCHAVGAAHAAGIVHRDLKLENVFLAQTKRSDAPFTVKVLDFGIAKLVEEARASTNTGIMGSPYWMAPEQTEQRAPITAATDVWALGLIAYRLLTGNHYWRCASDVRAGMTVFLRELVLEPLVSATDRATEQGVTPRLPGGFDAWFSRCVVREQGARFPNATAAIHAFRSIEGAAAPASTKALSRPAVTVSTGANPGESATALGSARTIGDPRSAPPAEPEPEEIRAIPTQKLPLWIFAAAGLAIVGGVAAFSFRGAPPSATVGSGAPPLGADPANNANNAKSGAGGEDEPRCPKTMAAVRGGSFAMGSATGEPDEKPVHTITLNGFCLDTTEVLVSEYAACVAAKQCPPASKVVAWEGIKPEEKDRWSAACNAGIPGHDDHPVNCVTWDEADAYCRWAGKRLPTEEEWEFAARGSDGRAYPWGNEPPSRTRVNACGDECAKGPLGESESYVALYEGTDGFETTAPGGSFKEGRTPEGIFDLAGNVWEWTESHYCQYPGNNCNNQWRVARGGAWNSDVREGVRPARRERNAHDARASDVGFRCAK